MKIALVSPYDFAYPGGVVNHISCLEREFTRKGHEVKIIAPASEAMHTLGDRFIRIGNPRSFPVSGSIARITVAVKIEAQIREAFAREKFDICHLHEPLMPTLNTTTLQMHLSPMVGTFHASGAKPWYTLFGPVVKFYLDRWYRKLDGRIAVSSTARDYVNAYFPGEYTIIPNGIDTGHFNCHAKPLEKYNDGKTNILFVGRLEKRKGFDYLLKAYKQSIKEIPNCRLIAVGPGTRLRKKYEKQVTKEGLKDVVFAGYATFADLPRYYQTADVVCFPATGRESFGIVLLEAMSVGKPIIATAIDGFANVLTHGTEGLSVPPRDVESLTESLLTLIKDKSLCQQMGANGQQKALVYDWSHISQRILDFYQETLDRVSSSQDEPKPAAGPVGMASGK
jgi:phosphatidylinositol alpha-mannosyltransferase